MRHAFPASKDDQCQLRRTYATELMLVSDSAADGIVDFGEFERFVRRKEQELWALFCLLDRSGDGALAFDDLSVALESAGIFSSFWFYLIKGINVKKQELHAFMSHIDIDNDGTFKRLIFVG
jgi:solute carrier family 25 phosphate transporter 23/24/25/41